MNGLRWTIGLLTAVAVAGWIALNVIGGGFRRSFGASDNSAVLVPVGLIAAALIVASVVWPQYRALMHVVALIMLGLAVASVFLLRDTIFVGSLALFYVISWFVFYYRVVWATSTPT